MRLKAVLKAWFPNRLNIVVALVLLPFWSLVALGFFSMFLDGRAHSHAAKLGSRVGGVPHPAASGDPLLPKGEGEDRAGMVSGQNKPREAVKP